MTSVVSPLAPASFPDMPQIGGVRFATVAAGLRYQGRDDVMLAVLDPGTTLAGTFTRSATRSAAVLDCQEKIGRDADGGGAAILVNSGNANAFTGRAGHEAVAGITGAAAGVLGLSPARIFTSSTGVIGEPLPRERITARLADLRAGLDAGGIAAAARAIMTTDTFPKGATRTVTLGGGEVRIAGIAKGSGMIAPDMATMLSFVATDADLPAEVLQRLLTAANDRSFNSITVDGDTSTSDTLLLAATGRAGNTKVERAGDPLLRDFARALESLLIDLAHQVVRDGEGAQKFVTIEVRGAASARAARRIGLSIANSPLVKTAIAGEDANWGRIVMAVGKAGEKADRDRLSVAIGGVTIAEKGQPREGFDEAPVAAHMKGREILIEVDIGIGRGKATVWTCDLTHGYIDINADYRS